MVRHIIFDCFGTLVSTGSGSLDATKKILLDVGAEHDPKVFYKEWKTHKKRMMAESECFLDEKTWFILSLAEMFRRYRIAANADTAVYPMLDSLFGERKAYSDVNETLAAFRKMGVDCAIGSTTDDDSLSHCLAANGLKFENVFTSEGMHVYKPEPAFYETILRETGWDKAQCLFVGDSYTDDVFGPKRIGMKAALLDREGKHAADVYDPMPDHIIRSLLELPALCG
ncbi:MAG: HAD family hydrolase [Clostridiales bacterium]|nr:HAD family hydrolase [Clostridiales bacterium]